MFSKNKFLISIHRNLVNKMKLVYYKMITKIFMSILNNIVFHHIIIRNAIDELS